VPTSFGQRLLVVKDGHSPRHALRRKLILMDVSSEDALLFWHAHGGMVIPLGMPSEDPHSLRRAL